jgi:type VI protein secretion system component VasF
VEHAPSPARAERNQRRKLEFVPVWPLVASIALLVVLYLVLR